MIQRLSSRLLLYTQHLRRLKNVIVELERLGLYHDENQQQLHRVMGILGRIRLPEDRTARLGVPASGVGGTAGAGVVPNTSERSEINSPSAGERNASGTGSQNSDAEGGDCTAGLSDGIRRIQLDD